MKQIIQKLTVDEINVMCASADSMRTCPNIGQKSIGYHRTFKMLSSVLDDIKEEFTLMETIFDDKIKKLKIDFPNPESKEYLDKLSELKKELKKDVDKFYKNKYEVSIHIFKRSSFPSEPKDFGEKDVIVKSTNKDGESLSTYKFRYWEEFIKGIDILVLEDEEYDRMIFEKDLKEAKK